MTKNKQEKDTIEKIIETLIKRQYLKKFLGLKERIDLKSIYDFFKKELRFDFLEEKPFKAKAKKVYNKFKQQYHRIQNNDKLNILQGKYKKLRIIDAYAHLVFSGKWKLKNDDLELFEEMLEILFADIKKQAKRH